MTRYLHNFNRDYSFGGNTFAVEQVDGVLFVGVAHCSYKDQYSKAIGRDIAVSYLDEMKHRYNTGGYTACVIGDNIPGMCKITGFVVDDNVMVDTIIQEDSYNASVWNKISSHVKFNIDSIQYMEIEGAELLDMLVNYYNMLVNNAFTVKCRDYLVVENV